jgi:hypothetical protein
VKEAFLVVSCIIFVFVVLLAVGAYQKHYQEVLAKFDYEKMVGVGKDFEFAVCDKAKPCSTCDTRNHLALLVQRIVREEREYNGQLKKWEYRTRYHTFYIVSCGHCGKKTMKENCNLADAMYEWETK